MSIVTFSLLDSNSEKHLCNCLLTAGPEVVTFQGEGNNLLSESSRTISRPPSNYNNRPQQVIGPQKGIDSSDENFSL